MAVFSGEAEGRGGGEGKEISLPVLSKTGFHTSETVDLSSCRDTLGTHTASPLQRRNNAVLTATGKLFDLDCSGRHRRKFYVLDVIAWSDPSSQIVKMNFSSTGLDSDHLGLNTYSVLQY